jgi:xanthine dehydrogenase accessory factor
VALAELAVEPIDAAVVMTHLAEHDLEALRVLAARQVGYLGLLGPPARRDELLARLTDAERSALAGRLHAPVGLPLGGEGPEAIALAIAAELQRAFSAQERPRAR